MKSIRILPICTWLLVASSPVASAASVKYLTCPVVNSNGATLTLDYTLNEDEGKVTELIRENGVSKTSNASFTASHITFSRPISSVGSLNVTFNRKTAELIRDLSIPGDNPPYRGTCELTTADEQVF